MRYRPFGRSGQAVSALTLVLNDPGLSLAQQTELVLAGLDCGVNAYETRHDHPAALKSVGEAIREVERKMVLVGVRICASADGAPRNLGRDVLIGILQESLRDTGLRWIDYILIEDPQPREITVETLDTLEAARQARRLRFGGVAGETALVDELMAQGGLDLLSTRYNLRSDWPDRNRLKQAQAQGMIISSHDYFPAEVHGQTGAEGTGAPKRQGLLSLALGRSRPPLEAERDGPYAFLNRLRDWTPEQVCLGYALTEPHIATIRVDAGSAARIEQLSAVVDRELPNGVPAQIEMARVCAL